MQPSKTATCSRAAAAAATLLCAAQATSQKPAFEAPVRMQAGGEVIRVESPGFAAPCWADTDGDGRKDLVVGQFSSGKMKVYRNLGDGKLAAGRWLEADGDVAEIPGVW